MIKKLAAIWDNTSFYLSRTVYVLLLFASLLFALSFFVEALATVALFLLFAIMVAVALDAFLIYRFNGITAERILPPRLSNGDDNKIIINIRNDYAFPLQACVIEELPFQLQERGWKRDVVLPPENNFLLEYIVHPNERGAYNFGYINIYVSGPLRLVEQRYITGEEKTVKVYPSFIQLRRYQLLAVAQHTQPHGVKRMRKLGHSMEFEQIKEYVRGDDYRTLNWKATARRGDFMVNSFTDERSQQIYCLINKGRVMKMPFEGMTLLDYAINASLVLSGVAVQKQDRAGLITFSKSLDTFLPADKKPGHINNMLEALHKEQTDFLEPDFGKLFSVVRNRITQRSLLVLFTNFESVESLHRELSSLKRLAHYHLLMVVFFENTELKTLAESKAKTTEDIYIKTIAEKYRHEKLLIAKELQQQGIITVLTEPKNLSINVMNKYLELKDRQRI